MTHASDPKSPLREFACWCGWSLATYNAATVRQHLLEHRKPA